MIISILIGFVSGVISGMGIGGGVILIPMLVFFSNIPQQSAQNINLIYFIPTALISIYTHKKNDNIESKIIPKLVIFGLVGAVIGACLANQIEDTLLRQLFGCFLLFMGLTELFKKT